MIWLFVLRGLNLDDLINGKYEGQHCGLGGVLGRRYRLSVDVNRGAQRRMSQQLLHDFEFRPHAPQQRRVGVPKCVPANPPLDSESLRNGRIIRRRIACPQYGWRPRWCSLAKTQSSGSRYLQRSLQSMRAAARIGWTGTGFCDASVLHRPTTP